MFWTVLPIRDGLWLCRQTDVGTQPVREIPLGGGDEVDMAAALRRVAVSSAGYCAVFNKKTVHIVSPHAPLPTVLELPKDLSEVRALHFCGEILYIGGSSSWQDTSRLGWIDASEIEPRWKSLDPPDVVGDPSLPVHALFSYGQRLVALDGSFTPKLSLLYDISTPSAPRYLSYTSIPSGLNDMPIAASLGRSYAAILTRSQHEDGKAWKIGLFDGGSMDEIATFYEHSARAEQIQTPRTVLVHEDLLLIAHDLKGLGVVRLDDRKDTNYEHIEAIRPWAQSYVPLQRITYLKSLGQGRIVDVRPSEDPSLFYIVVQRGGRTWWEEIQI